MLGGFFNGVFIMAASFMAISAPVWDGGHAFASGRANVSARALRAAAEQNRWNTVLLSSVPGVTGVAFSPDGTLLAGAYGDGAGGTWQVAAGKAAGLARGGWWAVAICALAIGTAASAVVITIRKVGLTPAS